MKSAEPEIPDGASPYRAGPPVPATRIDHLAAARQYLVASAAIGLGLVLVIAGGSHAMRPIDATPLWRLGAGTLVIVATCALLAVGYQALRRGTRVPIAVFAVPPALSAIAACVAVKSAANMRAPSLLADDASRVEVVSAAADRGALVLYLSGLAAAALLAIGAQFFAARATTHATASRGLPRVAGAALAALAFVPTFARTPWGQPWHSWTSADVYPLVGAALMLMMALVRALAAAPHRGPRAVKYVADVGVAAALGATSVCALAAAQHFQVGFWFLPPARWDERASLVIAVLSEANTLLAWSVRPALAALAAAALAAARTGPLEWRSQFAGRPFGAVVASTLSTCVALGFAAATLWRGYAASCIHEQARTLEELVSAMTASEPNDGYLAVVAADGGRVHVGRDALAAPAGFADAASRAAAAREIASRARRPRENWRRWPPADGEPWNVPGYVLLIAAPDARVRDALDLVAPLAAEGPLVAEIAYPSGCSPRPWPLSPGRCWSRVEIYASERLFGSPPIGDVVVDAPADLSIAQLARRSGGRIVRLRYL